MNTAIEKLKKNDENFININLYSNDSKLGIIDEVIKKIKCKFWLKKGIDYKKIYFFSFFLVMASRYTLFKKFENKEYISIEDLPKICDYICGNLNSWTRNYHYWYNMYSYISKVYIVYWWREEKGRRPIARLGRQFVKINWLIFFFDETHQNCEFRSVYYKQFYFYL